MLVALPDGYKPEHVAPALARKVQTLPHALRRSLTWDRGPEMRDWKHVHVDTGIDVFSCDPRAPWQRGTNENTNGLLRQYFPKGFDFSTVTEIELDAVADELNDRPASALPSRPPPSSSQSCCCNNRQNPPIAQRDRRTALRHAASSRCRLCPSRRWREVHRHFACGLEAGASRWAGRG